MFLISIPKFLDYPSLELVPLSRFQTLQPPNCTHSTPHYNSTTPFYKLNTRNSTLTNCTTHNTPFTNSTPATPTFTDEVDAALESDRDEILMTSFTRETTPAESTGLLLIFLIYLFYLSYLSNLSYITYITYLCCLS